MASSNRQTRKVSGNTNTLAYSSGASVDEEIGFMALKPQQRHDDLLR
jgi:hypothetical protein